MASITKSKLEDFFEYEKLVGPLDKLKEFIEENELFHAKYNSEISRKYCSFLTKEILKDHTFSYIDFLIVFYKFLKMDLKQSDYDSGSMDTYDILIMNIVFFFQYWYYDDLLGLIHMELIGPKQAQASGQFYTPFEVAILMNNIIDVERDKTVHDPTVGGGVMLLAAKFLIHKKHGYHAISNRDYSGQDLSSTAYYMSKVVQMILTDHGYMRKLIDFYLPGIKDENYKNKLKLIQLRYVALDLQKEEMIKNENW